MQWTVRRLCAAVVHNQKMMETWAYARFIVMGEWNYFIGVCVNRHFTHLVNSEWLIWPHMNVLTQKIIYKKRSLRHNYYLSDHIIMNIIKWCIKCCAQPLHWDNAKPNIRIIIIYVNWFCADKNATLLQICHLDACLIVIIYCMSIWQQSCSLPTCILISI